MVKNTRGAINKIVYNNAMPIEFRAQVGSHPQRNVESRPNYIDTGRILYQKIFHITASSSTEFQHRNMFSVIKELYQQRRINKAESISYLLGDIFYLL